VSRVTRTSGSWRVLLTHKQRILALSRTKNDGRLALVEPFASVSFEWSVLLGAGGLASVVTICVSTLGSAIAPAAPVRLGRGLGPSQLGGDG
jgi:hypothetical protein